MHRYTTEQGVDFIKSFEGFKPYVYKDIAGLNTIGYGHLIRKGEVFPETISEEEGEIILKRDLYKAERSILRNINVPLFDNQFNSLVSWVFNIGSGAIQRSTLRMKLNRGDDIDDVGDEFLKWVYAGGRRIKGLIRRRKAERLMFIG